MTSAGQNSSSSKTADTPAPSLAEPAVGAASLAAAADSQTTIRLLPFGFEERVNFDARQELQKTRSKHFSVPPPVPDDDIWRRPPPDFRPQAWEPRPPKRNSRDAVQPWRYRLESDARYEAAAAVAPGDRLPALGQTAAQKKQQQQQKQRMQTLFRLMRPNTAKQRFVQEGALPREPYGTVGPHDFRQYPPIQSLGLPEFTTAIEKDPNNIRFLSRNRDTIVGPLHEIKNMRDASGTMWSAVRQPPKWDPRLHLQQNPFPNISCEYTRYRPRNRNPFDGFMDTVEAGLEKRWLAEKLAKSTDAQAA
ncbi:hypothetical protein BOX15_Mlig032252g1 [Macrostomum lignano]|uniref:Uncharacterized protein n=1 Tax=Macrostomum lignano TaxID=282301 RepID=A0A267ERK9_9PLAT|nr:hypothetical protein BOX15_Mlig032252g1 [Macrostomum lignano]